MRLAPGRFAPPAPHRHVTFLSALAVAAALAIAADPAAAVWTQDPATPVVVCTEEGDQHTPRGAPDGTGGVIIAWTDGRTGASSTDIYAQRLDASGNPLWPAGGVVVDASASIQQSVHVAEDGHGGAYILWLDIGLSPDRVRVARLDANGNHLWGSPVNLIDNIKDDTVVPYRTALIPDGVGGAIACFGNASFNVYAQRIYPSGALPWGPSGVVLASASQTQSQPTVASDGAGGAVAAWHDRRNGNTDIFAQRVDSTGATTWTVGGVPVCENTSIQSRITTVSDGTGGAIIGWLDARTSCDFYGQRLDGSGTVQWAADGALLAGIGGTCANQNPSMAADGSGGMVAAWSAADIFAQRFDASGAPLWNAGTKVTVCGATGSQFDAQVVSDGASGALVAWRDLRNLVVPNVYAQHLDATGSAQWLANGDSIQVGGFSTFNLDLINLGSGTAVAAWQASALLYDIHAERIPRLSIVDVPSPSASRLSLMAAPNPSRHYTDLQFDLPVAARGTAQIYDVAGRRIRTLFVGDLPAGPTVLRWDGREDSGVAAPGGIYFVRLRTEGSERTVGFVRLGQ